MTTKISPYTAKLIETKIDQAMGFASVCWSQKPRGIFKSELALTHANSLRDELFELLGVEVLQANSIECVVCGDPIHISIFKNDPWCSELCRELYVANTPREEISDINSSRDYSKMTEIDEKDIIRQAYAVWDYKEPLHAWDWVFDRWLFIPRERRYEIIAEYIREKHPGSDYVAGLYPNVANLVREEPNAPTDPE